MTTKSILGIALARISDKRQSAQENGSLDKQITSINNYLERLSKEKKVPHKLIEVISETESASEKNTRLRTSLPRIKKLIEDGTIKFVVVDHLTRYSRDLVELQQIKQLVIKHKGAFFEVASSRNIISNQRTRNIEFDMKSILAESETNMNQERQIRRQREACVYHGKDFNTAPVIGLDPHPKDAGYYVRNEDEILVLFDIVKAFLDTKSLLMTTQYCIEKNYRTKRYETHGRARKGIKSQSGSRGGSEMTSAYLKTLLTNPKLRGVNSFEDDLCQFTPPRDGYIHGYETVQWKYRHGAIIPEKMGKEIDAVLELAGKKRNKRTKAGELNLLQGLIFHHQTGAEMTCTSAKANKHHYYRRHGIPKCLVARELLESKVESHVLETLGRTSLIEDVVKRQSEEVSSGKKP